jgi:hypothetical protein
MSSRDFRRIINKIDNLILEHWRDVIHDNNVTNLGLLSYIAARLQTESFESIERDGIGLSNLFSNNRRDTVIFLQNLIAGNNDLSTQAKAEVICAGFLSAAGRVQRESIVESKLVISEFTYQNRKV